VDQRAVHSACAAAFGSRRAPAPVPRLVAVVKHVAARDDLFKAVPCRGSG
jgi:hypothetical protein